MKILLTGLLLLSLNSYADQDMVLGEYKGVLQGASVVSSADDETLHRSQEFTCEVGLNLTMTPTYFAQPFSFYNCQGQIFNDVVFEAVKQGNAFYLLQDEKVDYAYGPIGTLAKSGEYIINFNSTRKQTAQVQSDYYDGSCTSPSYQAKEFELAHNLEFRVQARPDGVYYRRTLKRDDIRYIFVKRKMCPDHIIQTAVKYTTYSVIEGILKK